MYRKDVEIKALGSQPSLPVLKASIDGPDGRDRENPSGQAGADAAGLGSEYRPTSGDATAL